MSCERFNKVLQTDFMCDKWRFLQKAFVFLICLSPLFSFSQQTLFTGEVVDVRSVELSRTLDAYQVYSVDLSELSRFVQSDSYDNHISLKLPGYGEFEIDLFHNQLKAENYQITVQTESGVEVIPDDGTIKTASYSITTNTFSR